MRPFKFLQKIPIPFLRYFLASILAITVAASVLGSEAVFLEWDKNQEPNIAGYKVFCGTRSGNFTKSVSTGLVPQAEITGLDAGATYYFAVQAVNTQSIHSPLSGEIAFTLPAAAAPQITVLAEDGAPLANQTTTLSFEYASLVSKVQSKRITLKNNGSTRLNRLGITLDGTDPTSFSLSSPLPGQVSAAINGGFELGFSDWGSSGNVRVVPHANAAEGGAILQFNGANSSPGGAVFQRIATIPGTRYVLSFDAGAVAANFNSQKLGIRVTGEDTLISKSITIIGGGDSAVKWESHSLDFVATSQSTLVTLSDQSTATHSIDLWIDNVRLLTASEAPNLVARTPRVTSLQPGESVSFDIAYRPAYPGPKSASLHISSDDPDDDPFNIQLAGSSNLAQPEIAVEFKGTDLVSGTASVNLNTVAVGSSPVSQTLTLRNHGGSNLTKLALGIDGAHAGEFTTSGLLTPALAPGASTTVQIFLKPTSGGSKTAALRIASNDLDESPFVIQLAGYASAPVAPEISVQLEKGTALSSGLFISNLGVTNIGSTSPLIAYIIKNIGSSTLTGLKLAVDNSEFVFSQLTTTSLAPGAATTLNVSFKPTSVGLKSATLRISSNDADENPFNVGLAATGATAPTPEIAVLQIDGSELASGQSNFQFGSTQVGIASSARTFTIRNLGTANLTNLALSTNNNQFAVSSFSTTTLAPGASTSFSITFKPATAGAHPATVRISSNDADENPFDIHLSGTGTMVDSPPAIAVYLDDGSDFLSGNRSFLEFGDVSIGRTVTRTLTIRNLGGANLTGLNMSYGGFGITQFSVVGFTGSTLAPGASTTLKVNFTPTIITNSFTLVYLVSNDKDKNPFYFIARGKGTPAVAAVAATPVAPADSSTAVAASAPPNTSVNGIAVVDDKKYLMLTATWLAGDRSYNEIIEVSPNLVDWYSGSNHTTTMISSPNILQVRDNSPLGSTPSRFVRLQPTPRTADR